MTYGMLTAGPKPEFPSELIVKAALRGNAGAWSRDGRRFAYATDEGTVFLLDAPGFGTGRKVLSDQGPVDQLLWAPGDKYLIVLTKEGRFWIVSAPEFNDRRSLTGIYRDVKGLVPSPDGHWLVFDGERAGGFGPGGYRRESLWLLDARAHDAEKDLLPPGAPFRKSGSSGIQALAWLDDDRIFFRSIAEPAVLAITSSMQMTVGIESFASAAGRSTGGATTPGL